MFQKICVENMPLGIPMGNHIVTFVTTPSGHSSASLACSLAQLDLSAWNIPQKVEKMVASSPIFGGNRLKPIKPTDQRLICRDSEALTLKVSSVLLKE